MKFDNIKVDLKQKKSIYMALGLIFWMMAIYDYLVVDSALPGARWIWFYELTLNLFGVHGFVIAQCIIGAAFLCAALIVRE